MGWNTVPNIRFGTLLEIQPEILDFGRYPHNRFENQNRLKDSVNRKMIYICKLNKFLKYYVYMIINSQIFAKIDQYKYEVLLRSQKINALKNT